MWRGSNDFIRGPAIVRASVSTRPSIGLGGLRPRIHSTVGATSTLPLARVSTTPERKSGPAATSVLCRSKGLRLTCAPWPAARPGTSAATIPGVPAWFFSVVQRSETTTSGTPSAHNGSIKADVVQSLHVGLVPLSAGNSSLRLVITPNSSAGRVEPANTLAAAAQDVRGARWLMCDVGRVSAKAVPLAVEFQLNYDLLA